MAIYLLEFDVHKTSYHNKRNKEKVLCICNVDLKLCWILKSQFQFPFRKDMELKSINLKDLPVSLNASIVVAVKSLLE